MKKRVATPPTDGKTRAGVKRKRIIVTAAAFIVGILALPSVHNFLSTVETAVVYIQPPSDILDPGDPAVGVASFEPILVQPGTSQAYTGNGPPGIRLVVDAPGDVIGWTVSGWANATAPPPLPANLCSSDTVYFDENDWIFESGGSPVGPSHSSFETIPTTVPGRLTPSGDQCHLRIYAVGTWHVSVCIEGEPIGKGDVRGPPREPHKDDNGTWHIDIWDKCIERLFQVPA